MEMAKPWKVASRKCILWKCLRPTGPFGNSYWWSYPLGLRLKRRRKARRKKRNRRRIAFRTFYVHSTKYFPFRLTHSLPLVSPTGLCDSKWLIVYLKKDLYAFRFYFQGQIQQSFTIINSQNGGEQPLSRFVSRGRKPRQKNRMFIICYSRNIEMK